MKNKKFRNASKAIIFVLVAVIIYSSLNPIFKPKWLDQNAETSFAQHFYEFDNDKIEMIFLGSSQITCCIDTVELYEKYGILAYDLGGSLNTLTINYYWMLDALSRHKTINTVVVDTSLVFNGDNDLDANFRKNLDYMKWSKYKFQAVEAYYENFETPTTLEDSKFETMINFAFPMMRYHSRWNDLDEVDFNVEKYDLMNCLGFSPTASRWQPNLPYEDFCIENDTVDKMELFDEVQYNYLIKIIDECKSRSINCVLIKTPKAAWSLTGHNFIQKLADEKDVPFLEFTTDKALKEIGYVYEQDMRDRDHLNARGSVKLADWLGNYFIENGYKFTDYRGSGVVDKKTLNRYHKQRNLAYLNSTLTPEEFLKELNKRDYDVAIQSSADITDYWTPELQKQLEKYGFTLDIASLHGMKYTAVVQDGKTTLELVSPDKIETAFKVIPSTKIKLVTAFSETTTKVGRDSPLKYSKNGLRLTAFDKDTGNLVSRATFYVEDDELKLNVDLEDKA
ncbi:MAG: hypothetical protein IKI33_00810 [Eubacterium sp.]|nr:hypothetical protein [Eubacterium sp.]